MNFYKPWPNMKILMLFDDFDVIDLLFHDFDVFTHSQYNGSIKVTHSKATIYEINIAALYNL